MTHKSVSQECPTRRRVAAERNEWWYYGLCLRTVCGGPIQRCANAARKTPRGGRF